MAQWISAELNRGWKISTNIVIEFNMNDSDFIKYVSEQLSRLHEEKENIDFCCKVSLEYVLNFKKKIYEHINLCKNEKIIKFELHNVVESPRCVDIRQYMDDDLVNELAKNGYVYLSQESSNDVIILENKNIECLQ